MVKYRFLFLLLLGLVTLSGYATPNGKDNKKSLELIPDNPFVREKIDSLLNHLQPDLFAESLNIYKKPSGVSTSSKQNKLDLLNASLSLSTLEGLKYFSKTRGKMRVLYEKSFVIDGPNTERKVSDPVLKALPDSLSIYVKQEDTTFGDKGHRTKRHQQ